MRVPRAVVVAGLMGLVGLVGLARALVSSGMGDAVVVAQREPGSAVSPSSIAGPGGPPAGATPARASAETDAQYRQRAAAALKPGGTVFGFPQETRGRPVEIAGRMVQLPADAYVDGVITNALCAPGAELCETPALVIRRGASHVTVGTRSGRVLNGRTAPGDEHAFDFLTQPPP